MILAGWYRKVRTLWRRFWILPIDFYRKFISPALPDSCLYAPSCSAFTRQAILRHGLVAGTVLGLFRILRCLGLLFDGGEDPVPERITFKTLFRPWRAFFRFRKKK